MSGGSGGMAVKGGIPESPGGADREVQQFLDSLGRPSFKEENIPAAREALKRAQELIDNFGVAGGRRDELKDATNNLRYALGRYDQGAASPATLGEVGKWFEKVDSIVSKYPRRG